MAKEEKRIQFGKGPQILINVITTKTYKE